MSRWAGGVYDPGLTSSSPSWLPSMSSLRAPSASSSPTTAQPSGSGRSALSTTRSSGESSLGALRGMREAVRVQGSRKSN